MTKQKSTGVKQEILQLAREIVREEVLVENPTISGWENVERERDIRMELNLQRYLTMAIIDWLDGKRPKEKK